MGIWKIIQISTTWVEENSSTQTSFVTTVLCDNWTVWRQYWLFSDWNKWEEVTKSFYNKEIIKEKKEEEIKVIEEIKKEKWICNDCKKEELLEENWCCEVCNVPF